MERENKELLLRDLCARLPYGVKVSKVVEDWTSDPHPIRSINLNNIIVEDGEFEDGTPNIDVWDYEDIKPYLFPLSSMTDKELIEFLQIRGMNLNSDELKTFRNGETAIVSTLPLYSRHIDWLNAHYFDYRGLIEKSLALDATNLNIY